MYTLVIHANDTYAVLIDNEVRQEGELEADWDFLPPKTIADPEARKPEDWDDRAKIPDETDGNPPGGTTSPRRSRTRTRRSPKTGRTKTTAVGAARDREPGVQGTLGAEDDR